MKSLANLVRPSLFLTLGLALLAGCSGCDDPTNPPTDPFQLGLNIYLYQHPQESVINENVYIGGRLNDNLGNAQRGVRVSFSISPDSVGAVTPFANTNPDSATGFATRVTFIGRKPGIALITGLVLDGQDVLGRDTVSIRVRDPING